MAVLFWAYAASLSEIILVGHRALYVVESDRKYHPFLPYAYFLGISPRTSCKTDSYMVILLY